MRITGYVEQYLYISFYGVTDLCRDIITEYSAPPSTQEQIHRHPQNTLTPFHCISVLLITQARNVLEFLNNLWGLGTE